MRRRELLRGAAVGGIVAGAGCTDLLGNGDAGGPDRWPTFGYDTRNVGYLEDGTGPTGEPETAWEAEIDGVVLETPAVDEGGVYAATTGTGRLYGIDRDGERRWSIAPGGEEGWLRSPTLADGGLYTSGDGGMVYAVDPETGDVRWEQEVATSPSSLVVADGVVYVAAAGDGTEAEPPGLYALDATDGAPLTPDGEPYVQGGGSAVVPAIRNGVAYLSTRGVENGVFAVELPEEPTEGMAPAGDEELRWALTPEAASTAFSNPSPTVVDGNAYVGIARSIYAINPADGRQRWRTPVGVSGAGAATAATGDDVYATVVEDWGHEVVARVVSLDAGTGEEQWERDLLTADGLIPDFLTRLSPVVVGDTVYVRTVPETPTDAEGSVSRIVALDRHSGEPRWSIERDGMISNLAVAGGAVYAGVADGEGRLEALAVPS